MMVHPVLVEIENLRIEKRYSKRALAKVAGLCTDAYSDMNLKCPSLYKLEKLAAVLGHRIALVPRDEAEYWSG